MKKNNFSEELKSFIINAGKSEYLLTNNIFSSETRKYLIENHIESCQVNHLGNFINRHWDSKSMKLNKYYALIHEWNFICFEILPNFNIDKQIVYFIFSEISDFHTRNLNVFNLDFVKIDSRFNSFSIMLKCYLEEIIKIITSTQDKIPVLLLYNKAILSCHLIENFLAINHTKTKVLEFVFEDVKVLYNLFSNTRSTIFHKLEYASFSKSKLDIVSDMFPKYDFVRANLDDFQLDEFFRVVDPSKYQNPYFKTIQDYFVRNDKGFIYNEIISFYQNEELVDAFAIDVLQETSDKTDKKTWTKLIWFSNRKNYLSYLKGLVYFMLQEKILPVHLNGKTIFNIIKNSFELNHSKTTYKEFEPENLKNINIKYVAPYNKILKKYS